MAATTIIRSVGGIDDTRVAINNGTIMRTLSIGANWSYLRVGVRLAIEPGIGNILQGKRIFVGLCSGALSGWNNGSATTQHAVGMRMPADSLTGSYPNNFPTSWYDFFAQKITKRIGTTTTESAETVSRFYVQANADYRVNLLFVDIEKYAPPTWRFYCWGPNNNGAQGGGITGTVTKESFLAYMTVPRTSLNSTPFGTSGNYTLDGSPSTLTVTESSNGFLDTVNVFTDLGCNLEVSDIAVARFA